MKIHKGFYKYDKSVNLPKYEGMRYLCNQAVEITLRKFSFRWKDVTCKNCLRQKPKKEEDLKNE